MHLVNFTLRLIINLAKVFVHTLQPYSYDHGNTYISRCMVADKSEKLSTNCPNLLTNGREGTLYFYIYKACVDIFLWFVCCKNILHVHKCKH